MTEKVVLSSSSNPPTSVEYAAAKKKATMIAIIGEVIVMVFIILLINIAYGCGIDPVHSTRERVNIAIWTQAGSTDNLIESAVLKIANDPLTFGLDYHFKIIDSASVPLSSLGDAIQKGTYWGVYAVTSNASTALINSIKTGAPRSSSAVQYWYDQARGGASYGGAFGSIGAQISSTANAIVRSMVLSNPSLYSVSVLSAPALSSPVTISTNNIYPVLVNGAFTATGTAFLQLFLIGLIHVAIIGHIHHELHGHGFLEWQLDAFLGLHRLFGGFLLTLWPTIIVFGLGWKDPAANLSATNFFAYWGFLFLSLTVLQNIVHHLIDLLGVPMGAMACILTVITMNFSSAATNPFDTVPRFYSIGYLFPFYHMMVGTRHILFNSFTFTQFSVSTGVMCCWAFFLHWGLTMKKLWFGKNNRALHLYDDEELVAAEKRESQRLENIAAASPEEGTHGSPAAKNTTSLFSPEARPIIKSIIRQSIGVEIMCSVFFVLFLLVTFGGSWDPARYLYRLRICVVNLDLQNHPNSPSVLDKALSIAASSVIPNTGFTVDTAFANDFTFDDVYREVQEGRYWGALVLNSGAYASLTQWLASPSNVKRPSMTYVTFITNDKRGGGYVNGQLSGAANAAYGAMSAYVTRSLIMLGITGKNVYALSNPISTYNLLQYPLPNDRTNGVDGSINSMAIVLYLASLTLTGIIDATHKTFEPLGFSYKFRQTLKILHAGLAAFFVAFWPAISLLWYGYKMSGSQFFQFWAWIWLGMCAYLAAGMATSHIFGKLSMPVGILLFSINNASGGGIIANELQPFFFRIGYGLPFNNIVAGARYILFGSRVEDFNRAVWVLFIWVFYITFVASRLEFRQKIAGFLLGKRATDDTPSADPSSPESAVNVDVESVKKPDTHEEIIAAAVTAAIRASGAPDTAQAAVDAAVEAAASAAAENPHDKAHITVAAVAAAIHVANNPATHDEAVSAAVNAARLAHVAAFKAAAVSASAAEPPAAAAAVAAAEPPAAAASSSPFVLGNNPNPPKEEEIAAANKLVNEVSKKTLLMEAARVGDATQVYLLISKGADVNSADSDGATALMYAVSNNQIACVHALISAGANIEAKRLDNGHTALVRAAFWGAKESVVALLKAGADMYAEGKNGSSAYLVTKSEEIRSIFVEFGYKGFKI